MKLKKKISIVLSFALVFTMLFGATGVFAKDASVPVDETEILVGSVPIPQEDYVKQIANLDGSLQVATPRAYIDEVWVNKITVYPRFLLNGDLTYDKAIYTSKSFSKSAHSGHYVSKAEQNSLKSKVIAKGGEPLDSWYVVISYQISGRNAISLTHQTTDDPEITEYVSSPSTGTQKYYLSMSQGMSFRWYGYLTFRNASFEYQNSSFNATFSLLNT